MKLVHMNERASGARASGNDKPVAVVRGPDHGDEPAELNLRNVLAEALLVMLDRVEFGRIDMAKASDAGVALILEHNQVRCVLVVGENSSRHSLSPRELEVARLIAGGFTNRTIGATLEISSWTVSTHTRRIFAKLGVSCRAEMVARLFGVSASPPEGARQ
jgi:DNA-binding NarL/FixJ family response regulator